MPAQALQAMDHDVRQAHREREESERTVLLLGRQCWRKHNLILDVQVAVAAQMVDGHALAVNDVDKAW